MKYMLAVAGFSLLFSITAAAQKTTFGVKAGINQANLKFVGERQVPKTKFHAGIFANMHLTNRMSMQSEVLFSQQGANMKGTFEDKLNYINIPVLAQLKIARGFKLQTGPQLGILASYDRKVLDPRILVAAPQFTRADVSWVFGGAYVTRSGWGLDMRYNHGLSDISRSQFPVMPTRNRVMQIGLMYQFTCKSKHL